MTITLNEKTEAWCSAYIELARTMGLTPQEVVSATHVMHTAAYEALEEQVERS